MPPVQSTRTLRLLCLCAGLAGLLIYQRGNLNEYRLYFSESRQPAQLDFSSLSEGWTEHSLAERFSGFPVSCHPYHGPLQVQRACAVDVRSTNGVPALYMSFFFAGGKLDHVSVNVPWWSHGAAYEHLVATLGPPAASQPVPHSGVRLHGWRVGDGAAVFLNRDRPRSPLQWNAIYWRSATACRLHGCLEDEGQPLPH
jgi:hypothetical protein